MIRCDQQVIRQVSILAVGSLVCVHLAATVEVQGSKDRGQFDGER